MTIRLFAMTTKDTDDMLTRIQAVNELRNSHEARVKYLIPLLRQLCAQRVAHMVARTTPANTEAVWDRPVYPATEEIAERAAWAMYHSRVIGLSSAERVRLARALAPIAADLLHR